MSTVIKRNQWQIWGDVIFALFAREIRVGFNDKFGISWAVVQPVLFILALSFARGRMDGGETHGIPTFVFMAYGLIFVQVFLQTFMSAANAMKKNATLYAFRQVQPISAVIACGLFEILVKVFVILGLVLAMFLLNMEIKADDALSIIFYLLGLWLFTLSIGTLVGLIGFFIPEVIKVAQLMTRPFFFISGVFFSLKDIPQEYWWTLDWNPILHAIELSRAAAYQGYGSEGVSETFLGLVVLTSLFFTLICYQRYWKQAISR